MTPGSQQAEVPAHAPEKKGYGEKETNSKFSCLIRNLSAPCSLLHILCFQGFIRRDSVKTRLLNSSNDGINTGQGWQVFNAGPFTGKIDRSLYHSRNLFVEGPLDVHGTIGAGHPSYGQLNLSGGDAKARIFNVID